MTQFNYSIIVPYRDKYELFLKAVDSIADRKDIQIIIVDNSPRQLSDDEIPVKKLSEITYVTSSITGGAGCARNVGLKYAEGEYLLFLDADDYFTPGAFAAFDRYLDKKYDIVFFNLTSIRLYDGTMSSRHVQYSNHLKDWIKTNDERWLRYRWPIPIAKMYLTSFVKEGGFTFEEIPVQNDAWFSCVTGHSAARITGDMDIVYCITEGNVGQSLTKTITRENAFIRYCTRIRINLFLKSVGRYDVHIRLLGSLRLALVKFGLGEFFRYLKVARENRISVF